MSNKEEGAEEAGPIPDRGAAEAILRDGKVNVSSQSEADSLAQSGYGVRIEKNKLQLNLPEALYLVAEERLRVAEDDAQLKFQELRARAKGELGEQFDVREFHDVVLGSGAVPLDILERNVDSWIAARKKAAARKAN